MDPGWRAILWQQFGAAIDMLENAIVACPETLWGDRSRQPEFWYVAYHTLFFLDFNSSETDEGFAPTAPFNLDELDPAGILPERVYRKDELLAYLEHGRRKARSAIAALTDESLTSRCRFRSPDVTVAELFLYNLRHVQHHAAQLNLLLRQAGQEPPRWVTRAREAR